MMPIVIFAAILVGLVLVIAGKSTRRVRGLADAPTLDLDTRVLYSAKHGLSGRPDRLFREGQFVIPEEWKTGTRVYESHVGQLGAYFLLVEEAYGVRPPYGVIVTGDGRRTKIENTPELRARVLDVAEQIRTARRQVQVLIPVRQPAGKCRGCGMRDGCGQRSGEIAKA